MNNMSLYLVRPKYRKLSDFLRLKIFVDGDEVTQKLGIANVICVPIPVSKDAISVRTDHPKASLTLHSTSQTTELAVLILTKWEVPFIRRAARIEWINPRLIDTYAPPFNTGSEMFGLPYRLVRMILTSLGVLLVGMAVVVYGTLAIWAMPTNIVLVVVSVGFVLMGGYVISLGLVGIRGVRDFFNRPTGFR
jgi:hypothetical protein